MSSYRSTRELYSLIGPLRMRSRLSFLLAFCGACLLISACVKPAVRRGNLPEDYYEQGLTNMQRKLYEEAHAAFEVLKSRYPFSKYAVMAELKLADIDFQTDKHIEAGNAYDLFVQFHPQHEEVPYAMFMQAMSHLKEIPEDYWFMPPAFEKDQAEVTRAIELFRAYLSRYPKHDKVALAQKNLKLCVDRLTAHDLYVARFYKRERKHTGAIPRYENALAEQRPYGLNPAVMLELAQSYLANHQIDKAEKLLLQIVEQHANTKSAQEARVILAKSFK